MPDLSIPQNDAPFLAWSSAFCRVVRAQPSAYGMSQPDVDLMEQVVSAYRTALHIVQHDGARTKVNVAEKNAAKVAALQVLRMYVRSVQSSQGISDAAKIALGLHVRSRSPSRREVPQSSPLLKYIGSTPLSHTLACVDSFTPTSKRKPYGASGVQLFMAIGDEPTSNANEARYYQEFTRARFAVLHDTADARKVVSYFARWIGYRKDVGPWSLPVHAVVPWVGGKAKHAMPDVHAGELQLAA